MLCMNWVIWRDIMSETITDKELARELNIRYKLVVVRKSEDAILEIHNLVHQFADVMYRDDEPNKHLFIGSCLLLH